MWTILAGGLIGTLATMLRVEFSLLIAMTCLASLTLPSKFRLDPVAVSLGLGSAIGLASIYAMFGALLPDTAVAKAATGSLQVTTMFATLIDIAKAHGAASMLAVVVIVAWFYSADRAIRYGANRPFSIILNATAPLMILTIIVRQQAVQGYRYFVFMEFFLLAYNILVIDTENESPAPVVRQWRLKHWVAAGSLSMLCVCWQALDFQRFSIMIASRAASFAKFRDANLTDLKGTYGIAWDVGLVGFFSGATILDGNGLVNGREFARKPKADRLRWFVSHYPIKFVFGDEAQLQELGALIDLHSRQIRESFDFANFSAQPDRHFMMVRPD